MAELVKDLLQYFVLLVSTFVLLNFLPNYVGKRPQQQQQARGEKEDEQDLKAVEGEDKKTKDIGEGESTASSKKKAEKRRKKKAAKTAKKQSESGETAESPPPLSPSTLEAKVEQTTEAAADDSDSEEEDDLPAEQVLAKLIKQGKTGTKIGVLSAEERRKIAERADAAKAPYKVGEVVEALYDKERQYFPATVCAVHSDYTYTLEYDDGSRKTHVSRDRIRSKSKGFAPVIRQVELETTDNESDYGKEVGPDWEFESTSLEESAGGGWEMVSAKKTKKPAAKRNPETGEPTLTKKQVGGSNINM